MDPTEFKRYAISSLHSFISGFIVGIIPALDTIDFQHLTVAALVGVLFAGVRGGIKVLGEAFLVWKDRKSK